MTEHTEATAPADEEHPKGAFVLMLLFLLMIIGVWVLTYAIMLSRS